MIPNVSLAIAALAGIITFAVHAPYLRDIFSRKVQPHAYTWLIWSITTGIAALSLIHGEGGIAVFGLAIESALCVVIFFLAVFGFGSTNITKTDTIILVVALLAIILWLQLDSPLWSLLLVTAIDAAGYLPTLRKSWSAPRSESVQYWAFLAIANVLSILVLEQYNLLTVSYLAVIAVCNVSLVSVCAWRRRFVAI